MEQKRVLKGTSGAGQFAATSHAEPSVALAAHEQLAKEQFTALMTEELAGKIDSCLKGKIRGKDWYTGCTVDQVFESELDDEGGIYVYTRNPGTDEGVSYTLGVVDGKAQVRLNDDYDTGIKPRDLHPEQWAGPDDAAKEISHVLLDMEGGVTDAVSSRGGSPDGFASESEYRRWRER